MSQRRSSSSCRLTLLHYRPDAACERRFDLTASVWGELAVPLGRGGRQCGYIHVPSQGPLFDPFKPEQSRPAGVRSLCDEPNGYNGLNRAIASLLRPAKAVVLMVLCAFILASIGLDPARHNEAVVGDDFHGIGGHAIAEQDDIHAIPTGARNDQAIEFQEMRSFSDIL